MVLLVGLLELLLQHSHLPRFLLYHSPPVRQAESERHALHNSVALMEWATEVGMRINYLQAKHLRWWLGREQARWFRSRFVFSVYRIVFPAVPQYFDHAYGSCSRHDKPGER